MKVTRQCSRTEPSLQRSFEGLQEQGRVFWSVEREAWLVTARIELGGDGSRLGARGVQFLCPLENEMEQSCYSDFGFFFISVKTCNKSCDFDAA